MLKRFFRPRQLRQMHIGSPEGYTSIEQVPGADHNTVGEVAKLLMGATISDDPEQADDGFHDPLAVHIGLGVSAKDIPSEGWPKTFKRDVAIEILRHMPEDE